MTLQDIIVTVIFFMVVALAIYVVWDIYKKDIRDMKKYRRSREGE